MGLALAAAGGCDPKENAAPKAAEAKSGASKAEPTKPATAKAEPANAEPANAEPANAEPAKAAPAKAEPGEPNKPEPTAEPAEQALPELPELPENRLEYDLPVVADHSGGFDVSFAILKKGNPATGQGSLTVFGPEIKPGDKGAAKDWNDICDTRLNAFGPRVHGLRLDLNRIEPFPEPDTRIETGRSFRLTVAGWKLPYSAFKDREHEADIRLLGGDDEEVEVAVSITEPGQPGSLRGRFKAKVCPPAS